MLEGSVEEQWRAMSEKVKGTLKEIEEERKREAGEKKQKGWWDGGCREEKKKMRRKLRQWRRRGLEEEDYRKGKREYTKLCERKKREESERWEKKIKGTRREKDVWEIVNRERGGRKRVNEEIGTKEWKEYFMRLLGGKEGRVVRGTGGSERRGEEEDEKELNREEIKRAIGKLRERKASGIDGIPGEAWKYGREELEIWIGIFCNRVWSGEW